MARAPIKFIAFGKRAPAWKIGSANRAFNGFGKLHAPIAAKICGRAQFRQNL
jgi:hypothetical protein